MYVKYNRALVERYKLRDKIDPIALKDIDDSNEWLTGRTEDAEDVLVFEEDEGFTWGNVASASGVYEQRFNLRSRGSSFGAREGSSSRGSSLRETIILENEEEEEEDEGEEEEEDDEGYQSLDGDDMEEDIAQEEDYI